ncbi:MAG: oligosaccharide flippase family protein [Burkholderiaceae bacterium]|nr:oligosaccharide flippase family protein [Burkholderiaceae bacterium]
MWARIAQTATARAAGLVLGTMSLVLTARWLGPEGRGELAVATTWAGTLATLFGLSLGPIAVRRMAAHAAHAREAATAIKVLFLVACTGTLAAWAVSGVVLVVSPGEVVHNVSRTVMLLSLAAIPFFIWEQYSGYLLSAVNRIELYNRGQVFGRAVALMTVVVLVIQLDLGVAAAVLAVLLGQACIALAGVRLLRAHSRQAPPVTYATVRAFALDGVRLHPNSLGMLLMFGADVLLLNHLSTAGEVGNYQLATQFVTMLLIVPQAAHLVLSGIVSRSGPDVAWVVQKKAIVAVTAGLSVVAVLAGFTADHWLPLVVGPQFSTAPELLRWLPIAIVGMSVSTMMASQWTGRGYFALASTLTVAVGVVAFVSNCLLIPRHGAIGAVWALTGASLFSLTVNGLMALHCERRVPRRSL